MSNLFSGNRPENLVRLSSDQHEAAGRRWPIRHDAEVNGRRTLFSVFPELLQPVHIPVPAQVIGGNVVSILSRQAEIVGDTPAHAPTGEAGSNLEVLRGNAMGSYDQKAA